MGALEKRVAVRLTDEEIRMIEELAEIWYPGVPHPQGVIIRRAVREAYGRQQKRMEEQKSEFTRASQESH